jgi:hypothetical protein
MMKVYRDEGSEKENDKPNYGNNMPIVMTPNTKAKFPSADGQKPEEPRSNGEEVEEQEPRAETSTTALTPNSEEEGQKEEKEEKVATPSPSAPTPILAKASPSPSLSSTVNVPKGKKTKASTNRASEEPKSKNLLSNIPILGPLMGGFK